MISYRCILANRFIRTSETIFLVLTLVLMGAIVDPAHGQLDVWIDPGHGGNDPGALGVNGTALPNEKELNIGVSSYLENDLTGLGYFVYKTQNYDTTYYQPWQRREIAGCVTWSVQN